MSIIHRLIIKQIFKYMGIILIAVVFIYLAIDFFEKIDNFIEAELSANKMAIFFIYKIPLILEQILPVSLLIAVLTVFGLMKRSNEITALKSGGVSIYYLLVPPVIVSVFCAIFMFVMSEHIVPSAAYISNNIWLQDVKKERVFLSKKQDIWIKGEDSIIYINHYDSDKNRIFGVNINSFDPNFKLKRKITANNGVFINDKWHLYDIFEQIFNTENEDMTASFLKGKASSDIDILPDELNRVMLKSEEISIKEILFYIEKAKEQDASYARYIVDLHSRIASFFLPLLMALIGTATSIKLKTKESMATGIAYGIGIAFLYWIMQSFCLSLGYGQVIPASIGAWTANILFLSAALVALVKKKRSGRLDLNQRPQRPERCALPG